MRMCGEKGSDERWLSEAAVVTTLSLTHRTAV